jgi:hypothetical protein
MKLLITAVAIFASSTLAAKYAAGTICHSNIECERNCLDKQYTIVNEDGGYVFACDSNIADPVQWYNLDCRSFGSHQVEEGVLEAACKKAGGEFCTYTCVLSGKRSVDQDNRAKWARACGKESSGAPTQTELAVRADEEDARLSCS